ncbi:GalE2 [Desulforapulum autotrophicum HRM2]|uniref:GalE2 n=1 Tax=Desulforapulum autotrophicum (strain ATCC 43914 / DSM 3382 / VKM B-1955 / HRM2) TaxID=177437 RepID=C0QK35_DESAH|nr:NAD(P)-dependent oxidoreductase [Desulforapulum autotrophicum]ACN16061.1 GalE2 [Desulforapulum autotrophicum HRM2]
MGVPILLKQVLVTGATGMVGRSLVNALLKKGYCVRALVRKKVDEDILPARVEQVTGDITDAASVCSAMAGVCFVFHLAARLHVNNPSPDQKEQYQGVNVTGTLNVIEAASSARVDRIIFFSTISVYGAGKNNQAVDEGSETMPDTLYARTKLKAEQLIDQFCADRSGAPEVTILRLASVYGAGVKGNYRLMINAVQKGGFIFLGNGNNCRTLVHEEDVAAAAILAAEHPMARGKIYNVTDGTTHTVKAIVGAIARALERQPLELHVHETIIRAILNLLELSLFQGLPGVEKIGYMINKMNEHVAVRGEKIQQDLGFVPQWGLDRGMKQALKEGRSKP